MLKTFRVNDVCEFPNAELWHQALIYAANKGVPLFEDAHLNNFKIYECVTFYPDRLDVTAGKSEIQNHITIPEFFQNCDNWKECGSKPSEGEYIRYGAKVKVRDSRKRILDGIYDEPCSLMGKTHWVIVDGLPKICGRTIETPFDYRLIGLPCVLLPVGVSV